MIKDLLWYEFSVFDGIWFHSSRSIQLAQILTNDLFSIMHLMDICFITWHLTDEQHERVSFYESYLKMLNGLLQVFYCIYLLHLISVQSWAIKYFVYYLKYRTIMKTLYRNILTRLFIWCKFLDKILFP